MFIAVLVIIAKTVCFSKSLSRDEWIKEDIYIYMMEYCSAMRKKETLPFASTYMDLERIMLSEINERKCCMMSFMCGI